jgi:hypothetical protein
MDAKALVALSLILSKKPDESSCEKTMELGVERNTDTDAWSFDLDRKIPLEEEGETLRLKLELQMLVAKGPDSSKDC